MAKSHSFDHPAYVSEEKLSDFVEAYLRHIHEPASAVKREFSLGGCRFDFLVLTPNSLILNEVKITVSIDSVRQLLFYKERLEEFLYEENIHGVQIILSLYARYFDSEVVEICRELFIHTIKIKIKKNGSIDEFIDADLTHDRPYQSITDPGANALKEHFRKQHGPH